MLQTAFVGEHVIDWAALSGDSDAAIRTLHRGSGGYPLNAFVTTASVDELGLVDGADLDRGLANIVVRSLVAVIVSAYDDETFMIWEPTAMRQTHASPRDVSESKTGGS